MKEKERERGKEEEVGRGKGNIGNNIGCGWHTYSSGIVDGAVVTAGLSHVLVAAVGGLLGHGEHFAAVHQVQLAVVQMAQVVERVLGTARRIGVVGCGQVVIGAEAGHSAFQPTS